MDISGFFSWFLDMFVGVIAWSYGLLDDITFAGVSLLQFILWCLILSAVIPIIFSVARTQSGKLSHTGKGKGQKSSGGRKDGDK